MELTKEQIEQAIKDWSQTLEWAKVIDIDSLFEKSKRINTQHGLCHYFKELFSVDVSDIVEEFLTDEVYICHTIWLSIFHENFNTISCIEKRIEVLNILLSRC